MTTDNTIQAVFFDLDGTLIDTAPDMGAALNRVALNHGRQPIDESTYRPQVSHGSLALLKLVFNTPHDEQLLADLRQQFLREYELAIADGSTFFAGIETLLQTLELQCIPWGIITNKPEYLTLQLLDALNLTARCCAIIGADTASHAKPHPAPMVLACERSNVRAQNCLYLGDAERDIQAGRAVGMTTLIAGWGYIAATDNPKDWQADAFLHHPRQTLEYLTH